MKKYFKKIVCLVLLIVLLSALATTLVACNSGNWVYVTYYYNNELLEQEKFWQYAWSIHGDKHKEDADWDKDRGQIMTTVKKLVKKLYSERGKKVFFIAKPFLDGETHFYEYYAYSYTYGECRYNLETNSLIKPSSWYNSLCILYEDSRDNYILIAKDEP